MNGDLVCYNICWDADAVKCFQESRMRTVKCFVGFLFNSAIHETSFDEKTIRAWMAKTFLGAPYLHLSRIREGQTDHTLSILAARLLKTKQ